MSENPASFCAATSRPVRQEAPFVRHFLFRKQDHGILRPARTGQQV